MNSRNEHSAIYLSIVLIVGLLSPAVFADDDPDLDLTLTVLEEGQEPVEVTNEISLPKIAPSPELKNLHRDMQKRLSKNGKDSEAMDNHKQLAEDMVNKNRDHILNSPDVANDHIPVFVLEKAKLRDERLNELHDLINQISKDKSLDETKIKDLVKQYQEQFKELRDNPGKAKGKDKD